MRILRWIARVLIALLLMELTIIIINMVILRVFSMPDSVKVLLPSDAIYGSIAFFENSLQLSFELSYLIITILTFALSACYYQVAIWIIAKVQKRIQAKITKKKARELNNTIN